MELALDLLALYLGIIIPVIGTVAVAWSKLSTKLALVVETVRVHGIASDLSETTLDALKIKVALIEKDVEMLKQRLANNN